MRCISCRYSLKNLTHNRCPECGRAFDPDDPTTFDNRSEAFFRSIRRVCLWIAILGFPVVFGVSRWLGSETFVAAWSALGCVATPLMLLVMLQVFVRR